MTNKKCNTGSRVFRTLILLSEKELSSNEIIASLKNEYNEVFTNEVAYKYVNTLNFLNLDVTKEKDKYILNKQPPFFNLDEKEMLGLNLIAQNDFMEKQTKKNIKNFLFKINKHLYNETSENLKKIVYVTKKENPILIENEKLINQLETYIRELLTIKIELTNGEIYTGVPIELRIESNKVLFKIYQYSKMYDINIKDIKSIISLNKRQNIVKNSSISYELKGKLAKTYKLHPGEIKKESNNKDCILIINTLEAENTLLKRLMRYGQYCEVISPIDTRLKMKEYIKDTLKLYIE